MLAVLEPEQLRHERPRDALEHTVLVANPLRARIDARDLEERAAAVDEPAVQCSFTE